MPDTHSTSPHSQVIPILVATAFGLALSGCASRLLVPAPQAHLVPGRHDMAVAQSAHVRTTVQSEAWSGNPADLPSEITPLEVTIINHGNRSVRIAYKEFTLTSSSGFTYRALPPYQITGSIRQPVVAPHFAYSGFFIAPFYGPYYPGVPVWGSHWAYDPFYYQNAWAKWPVDWPVPLPTRDMRRMAIPAGVLKPGGAISGFLYFPKLPSQTERVTFRERLVDPKTKNTLAVIDVPFRYAR